MSEGRPSLARSSARAVAGLAYRTGMIRGLNRVANRWRSKGNGGGFPYLRRRRCGNVQILTYHRVVDRHDEFLPGVPAATFGRHMEYLARAFTVLPLGEAVRAIREADVPDNAIVITFDDGYRDNYDQAFPILCGLGLTATIFLTTGVIGTRELVWHDRVYRAFHLTPRTRPGDGDAAARRAALARLKRLEPRERTARIEDLERELEVDPPSPERPRLMLSWDEVREMAGRGISFGSHTVTHPTLTAVEPVRVEDEVVRSKTEIESHLGRPVTAFAYPNGKAGDYDEGIKQILRRSGYDCAVTTRFGTNAKDAQAPWDALELRRGGPMDASTAMFAAKLNLYKLMT